MNRAVRTIQTYLIYALPFVIACMAWSTLASAMPSGALWEFLSWNLMTWFATLIVFLVMLVASPVARESTLKRLADIHERDEREQYITGKASRTAYISTLSVMILFLFFSIFTWDLTSGSLRLGLGFSLLDDSKHLPLSKTAIILLFLGWQLVAFRFTARRERLE